MRKRRRVQARDVRMGIITGLLLAVCPPVGIVLLWKRRWSTGLKYALSAASVGILILAVALIPSGTNRVNGGVSLVGSEKQAEVYGPALPTAMVSTYTVSTGESVIASDVDETEVEYVYAAKGQKNYHSYKCKFAYASSQKLTPYEAYYLGYTPCKACTPPVYKPAGGGAT